MLPQVAPVLKACTTAFQLSLCPQMPTTGGSGRGGRVGGRDTSDRHRGSEQFGVRSGDTEVQAVLPARRGGGGGPHWCPASSPATGSGVQRPAPEGSVFQGQGGRAWLESPLESLGHPRQGRGRKPARHRWAVRWGLSPQGGEVAKPGALSSLPPRKAWCLLGGSGASRGRPAASPDPQTWLCSTPQAGASVLLLGRREPAGHVGPHGLPQMPHRSGPAEGLAPPRCSGSNARSAPVGLHRRHWAVTLVGDRIREIKV